MTDASEQTGDHTGAVIGFGTRRGEGRACAGSLFFISFEQAQLNLQELGRNSFDRIVAQGKSAWNEAMSRIYVEGGSDDQLSTFYSCLYRSLLFPRKFYEIDARGTVVHYSPYNGKVLPGYLYTDTGFLGYVPQPVSAAEPDVSVAEPGDAGRIAEHLPRERFFPEWASPGHRGCMVGNNSASVLTDAYLKGVKVGDAEMLYEGLVHGTQAVHPKVFLPGPLENNTTTPWGYVPPHSKTL